jgi:hypothetical protein
MLLHIANIELYKPNENLLLICVSNQKYLLHNDDAMSKNLQKFQILIIPIPRILSQVTRHGGIDNWIYWMIITRNYRKLFQLSAIMSQYIYIRRNSLDTRQM